MLLLFLPAVALGQDRELALVDLVVWRHGHHAIGERLQRGRPPAVRERRPFADDRARPDLTEPSTETLSMPSRRRKTSPPGSPCSVSQAPWDSRRIEGFTDPRMMLPESCRSRALSAMATSGFVSSWPHGVCAPNAVWNHWLAMVTPLLAAS